MKAENPDSDPLRWEEFTRVEMRVGTILSAHPLAAARRPAYVLSIDFGPYGQKKSSAQITDYYESQELIGQQVVAVVNFRAKQIANIQSQCLVLGSVDEMGRVILLQPERPAANGDRIG